ncbi:MAG TPA: hypothetical protein PKL23_04150 [Candidatus Egerieousia sp.]|nr:hypothetical protein [Candidatus Egerieousia sp.]
MVIDDLLLIENVGLTEERENPSGTVMKTMFTPWICLITAAAFTDKPEFAVVKIWKLDRVHDEDFVVSGSGFTVPPPLPPPQPARENAKPTDTANKTILQLWNTIKALFNIFSKFSKFKFFSLKRQQPFGCCLSIKHHIFT